MFFVMEIEIVGLLLGLAGASLLAGVAYAYLNNSDRKSALYLFVTCFMLLTVVGVSVAGDGIEFVSAVVSSSVGSTISSDFSAPTWVSLLVGGVLIVTGLWGLTSSTVKLVEARDEERDLQ